MPRQKNSLNGKYFHIRRAYFENQEVEKTNLAHKLIYIAKNQKKNQMKCMKRNWGTDLRVQLWTRTGETVCPEHHPTPSIRWNLVPQRHSNLEVDRTTRIHREDPAYLFTQCRSHWRRANIREPLFLCFEAESGILTAKEYLRLLKNWIMKKALRDYTRNRQCLVIK